MCGIAGIIKQSGNARDHVARVERMTHAVRHRGPDDSGQEVVAAADPMVIFGHRRLAIIDLSAAGRQPMYDAEHGNWITFNGEIYNYRELRAELSAHGHQFQTQTDTEVILKAYAQWGKDALARLRGIFAFAIWQPQQQELLLARDQLGVKPLYYWQSNDLLIFASEVRALLASQLIEHHLDLAGLRSYLAYGSVQEPFTLIAGVHSLLPGHWLSLRNGKSVIARYWQLPRAINRSTSSADLHAQLRAQLSESVSIQMVADVPLGSFLSGGIDSTAIAALAQKASNQPLQTFSIVFDEAQYDERVYARAAANYIKTAHTELKLSGEQVQQSLPAALAAFDQPSMDGLNTYFVSQVTKAAGLTVALSGVGGDELFGGYNGYDKALLAERWSRRFQLVPAALRSIFARLLTTFAANEAVRKGAELLRAPLNPYFLTRRVFNDDQIAALLTAELFTRSADWQPPTFAALAHETAGYDDINRASALELQTYMLSTLLRDTDQMSMAHALEVRVPLLDHKLVELLFNIAGSAKLDANNPKPLLTLPLNGSLPRECVFRPKRGFELPFAVWLRDSLQSAARAFFTSTPDQSSPFNGAGLESIWQQFQRGQLNWSRVWAIYVLNDWLTRHRVTI